MNINDKTKSFPIYLTFILILGIFLVGTDELILSLLLPELAASYNIKLSTASLTVSLYGLSIGLVVPFIAPYIDKRSRSKLLGWSLFYFSISSFFCALAPTIHLLLLTRLLSGVFAGIYIPTVYAFVGDHVAFKYRGRVMGLVMSGWSLSLIVGIPLGGIISDWFHWRGTFILIGTVGMMAALLSLITIKEDRLMTKPANQKNKFFEHLWITLKQKQVSLLIFTTFCNMFAFYGLYTFLGSYVQKAFNLSVNQSGHLIFFYGLGIALSPLMGAFVDYIGKRFALVVALFGLCLTLMTLTSSTIPLSFLYCLLIAWGALQSLFLTSMSALLSEQSAVYRGRIMSLYSLATNLAVAFGSSLMGMIYTTYGFHTVGLLCGLITGIGGGAYTYSYLNQNKKAQLPM